MSRQFYLLDPVTESVDQILSDVVGNGLTDGYLRIDGTGTAAPSDPDGLALKATLISRGWTVYTN